MLYNIRRYSINSGETVKKVPVFKRRNGELEIVREISREEAIEIAGDPDVEDVEAIYVLNEEELDEEEARVHEFRPEE
jgi:hypothetical protein